jgi:hypothetical protein
MRTENLFKPAQNQCASNGGCEPPKPTQLIDKIDIKHRGIQQLLYFRLLIVLVMCAISTHLQLPDYQQ